MSAEGRSCAELASILRRRSSEIAIRWEETVRQEVPALNQLSRAALVDHLPEFLDALASWIEGDVGEAFEGFRILAEGHALQRQTAGVELEHLTSEYAALRRVTLEALRGDGVSLGLVDARVRLNIGFDLAIHQAVHRYMSARDEVRERFVGILAHDLRDPLAAVAMSASFLADTRLDTHQTQLVQRIVRGSERIERMINDVLDFTRGRLGSGIPVIPAAADMADICRGVVDEASGARGAAIGLEVSGDLRGSWDVERVKQALSNLLSNAFHHGAGGVVVRAWEREDRKMVFTSVTNEGPVIPADAMSRLFDPFVRQQKTRSRGLGLGLFIVRQIALAHGGHVRVTSTEAGTTFTIEWPRIPLEQTPDRPS